MPDLDTTALEARAEKEIERGLVACQVAVARGGETVWTRSFGAVAPTARYWIASATKPIVSSAALVLVGEGRLDVTRPVADYVPEFARRDKHAVTVEQVLLMTCGFPSAPMASADAADPQRRLAQLADWCLEYEPGTQYVYHPMSAHWVLAELIERISGEAFCDFVERRVTRPLGLPRMLGIPVEEQSDVAQLSPHADPLTRSAYDYAAKIAVGEPGGGAVATAETLALFYQGLLLNPGETWDPDVLADARSHIRCTLPDPVMKLPANRTTAVVVGNGFGATWGASATAFGWNGAGGQIGFAEPGSGLSFAFLQLGDPDPMSQFRRGARMSRLALELIA